MITRLRVETKHDDVRVVHAIKEKRNDQYQYLAEFTPKAGTLYGGGDAKKRTILKSAGPNNPNLVSYHLTLKRGLYHVTIAKITEIDGTDIKTDPDTYEQYPEPVMVGERYVLRIKTEDTYCYGVPGVRVRISSREMPLDSQTVYYQIKKENISHIKYYVPFNQSQTIDFFVQDIRSGEIEFFLRNPSFKLEEYEG